MHVAVVQTRQHPRFGRVEVNRLDTVRPRGQLALDVEAQRLFCVVRSARGMREKEMDESAQKTPQKEKKTHAEYKTSGEGEKSKGRPSHRCF